MKLNPRLVQIFITVAEDQRPVEVTFDDKGRAQNFCYQLNSTRGKMRQLNHPSSGLADLCIVRAPKVRFRDTLPSWIVTIEPIEAQFPEIPELKHVPMERLLGQTQSPSPAPSPGSPEDYLSDFLNEKS